jgi:hypothetical protein
MLRCHLHTSNHDYNSKKIKGQIKKKGIGLTLTTYDNREIIKRKPSPISE